MESTTPMIPPSTRLLPVAKPFRNTKSFAKNTVFIVVCIPEEP